MATKADKGPILATLTLDPAYLADVIQQANVRYWGSLRRRNSGMLCDACGKSVADGEHATDDEVCGGSDGPGFILCGRRECGSRIGQTSVKARRAIYTRQRAANEEARKVFCWFAYERDGKDPTDAHIINRVTIASAIVRMAIEAPEQLGQLLARNADATTGDILVQLAAFDEVRYA